MKIVLPTYLVSGGLKGNRPIKDILYFYKQKGIQSVALNFTERGDVSFESDYTELNNLREYCIEQDIELSSISTFIPYQLFSIEKSGCDRSFDSTVLKMIEIASVLNIPFAVIHGTSKKILKSISYSDAIKSEINAISLYSKIAKEKGVGLCLENSYCGLLSTYDEWRLMFNENSYVSFCYDTGNSYFVSSPEKWCYTLRDKLEYVHLSDIRIRALRGMMVEFTEIGKGSLNMKEIINTLKRNKYQGHVMFEVIEEPNQIDEERINSIKSYWLDLYSGDLL